MARGDASGRPAIPRPKMTSSGERRTASSGMGSKNPASARATSAGRSTCGRVTAAAEREQVARRGSRSRSASAASSGTTRSRAPCTSRTRAAIDVKLGLAQRRRRRPPGHAAPGTARRRHRALRRPSHRGAARSRPRRTGAEGRRDRAEHGRAVARVGRAAHSARALRQRHRRAERADRRRRAVTALGPRRSERQRDGAAHRVAHERVAPDDRALHELDRVPRPQRAPGAPARRKGRAAEAREVRAHERKRSASASSSERQAPAAVVPGPDPWSRSTGGPEPRHVTASRFSGKPDDSLGREGHRHSPVVRRARPRARARP